MKSGSSTTDFVKFGHIVIKHTLHTERDTRGYNAGGKYNE